ncbi:serine carboxypeptidase-like 40 isoform X2 [Populus trichocarpa]|uniref:serine carboxypeptidase-like 40 isoform X2 n=1 Tax=Populus trichocarpa TaxID=3694 RepID=UPI000D1886B1|nr:serine carboxypeptidase-like 40 isoform X2 [Populus trichocarpa]|eukprot:XP_024464344.1 serine carboxypeptidase-like 40 isoform X2 [Populus trichocarpa]
MGKIPCLLLVFIVTLSRSVAQSHGIKNQGEALDNLYKAKFSRDSRIDTGPFEVLDTSQFEVMNMLLDESEVHPRQKGSKEKDRIKMLPGQPRVNFSQYGGYVTVNESAGSALYYYFVEADQHSKESALPLLLWLNGGPGCSSLGYGAMEELGPFRVHSNGKTLYRNKYSWNKVANVLFLESPAGVGFSYSNATSDYTYTSGDRETAAQNYMFLVNWLERFPEYKDRDFYIAGESYAGHYVPQLADTILHYNKKAKRSVVNLKGIMIGNSVINDHTDMQGMYDFFGTHAITSNENFRKIQHYCNFSSAGSLYKECQEAMGKADTDVSVIDIYNIYGPSCFNSNLTSKPKKTSPMNFDPCSDSYVLAYLNRPDVQEAMHANVTKLAYDWQPCGGFNWVDSASTVLPLLKEFMANGLRVWVFSGDTDGRVPVTSSQYSINEMNLPIKTQWHPWFSDQESRLVGMYKYTKGT